MKTLPFDTHAQLREKMFEAYPALADVGRVAKAEWQKFGAPGQFSAAPFTAAITNFYMTDPISRASVTMAKCTSEILPLTSAEAAE